jgi:molybdate transport system substrate-binding protein
VNTYIFNDVVPVGFTSQSFVYDSGQSKKLYWSVVDPKLYAPIEQGLVILKHGKENNAADAEKFYKYLLSSSAKAIFKKYGYHTE